MKRILLCTQLRPFSAPSVQEILTRNLIGSNTGNALFHTSVVRTLMTSADTVFDEMILARCDLSDALIDRVNQAYSMFIMPLANAFRSSYLRELRYLTAFVGRLKIPCVVVGVGAQSVTAAQLEGRLPFDDDVCAFLRAVLEKSAVVGLRGEYTAAYLKRLGFVPEQDFTVIGCPSMYYYGGRLPELRMKPLNQNSVVSVNSKLSAKPIVHSLIQRSCDMFPNYWYLPQTLAEICMLVYGVPIFRVHPRVPAYIPVNRRSPVLQCGHVIAFSEVPAWLEFMRDMDFCFGCNIHGNIAAILSGTPAIVIEHDLRVKEIAEYFEIPCVQASDVRPDESILDVYARADYGPMQRNHRQRFSHYVDFLNANGLEHVFTDAFADGELPYDRRLRDHVPTPPFVAPKHLGLKSRIEGWPVFKDQLGRFYRNDVKRRIKRFI